MPSFFRALIQQRPRWWSGASRGQSFVEVAITTPVLLLLMIGSLEAGWAYNAYITVTNATRDGARYGGQQAPTTTGICTLIVAEMARLSGNKVITVNRVIEEASSNKSTDTTGTSCACTAHAVTTTAENRYVEVLLVYTHSMIFGTSYFPSTWEMTSTARFPVAKFVTQFGVTSACN